jgi:uroporphyrin-3 C-methyltransferase
MTEKTPVEPVVETSHAAASTQQQDMEKRDALLEQLRKKQRAAPVMGAIAIVLSLVLSGGVYLHQQQQLRQQMAANQALADQISELQNTQQQSKQLLNTLQTQENQQGQTQQNHTQQQQALSKQFAELQDKVNSITSNDLNNWQLAQVNYLVKLAERKLWSDQDVTTALALLKNADNELASLNDPSLIELRRAINQDITTLSVIAQVDYDGITLKINQLANQVDNLRLLDKNSEDTDSQNHSSSLSGSVGQWRENLTKSWKGFLDDFITIRRRDTSAEPLLAPNQDIYLRENIRAKLLIAAQAVPRHQNEVYKQSLEASTTWIHAYYDPQDPATKEFLQRLDELSQRTVNMDLPGHLESQPILENLMQTRVRNLLQQPVAGKQGE